MAENREITPQQMAGATLAYIGDGVYELMVRRYVLQSGAPAGQLHKKATALVSAPAQFAAYKAIAPLLSEEEAEVFHRGRNANVSAPKRKDPVTHCHATGFEALFGYLYLCGRKERLAELFEAIPK